MGPHGADLDAPKPHPDVISPAPIEVAEYDTPDFRHPGSHARHHISRGADGQPDAYPRHLSGTAVSILEPPFSVFSMGYAFSSAKPHIDPTPNPTLTSLERLQDFLESIRIMLCIDPLERRFRHAEERRRLACGDAGLRQPRGGGVAEIVDADIIEVRPRARCSEGSLDRLHRSAIYRHDMIGRIS